MINMRYDDEYDARAVLKRMREDADVEEDGRRGGGGEGGARRWEFVFVLIIMKGRSKEVGFFLFMSALVCVSKP